MAGPHQQVEGQATESKSSARERAGKIITRPFSREKIHPQAAEPQMQQAEKTQRPRKRQQEVNERRWVERHGVPLGKQGNAAVVVGVPKRELAAPKTFFLEMRERISEEPIVARNKRLPAENDLRKRCDDQQGEQNAKARRRE